MEFIRQNIYYILFMALIVEWPITAFVWAEYASQWKLNLFLFSFLAVLWDIIGDISIYTLGRYFYERKYVNRLNPVKKMKEYITEKKFFENLLVQYPFFFFLVVKITPYISTPSLFSVGMKKYHFDYDAKNMDLFTKYMHVLAEKTDILVLDRSFISEMVYGPVLRNNCKLTIEQYTELLKSYKEKGATIIYLTAPKEILLERRANDLKDYEMIDKYYETLNVRYDEIMDYSSNYINILQYDSFAMNKEEIQNNTKRLIVKW